MDSQDQFTRVTGSTAAKGVQENNKGGHGEMLFGQESVYETGNGEGQEEENKWNLGGTSKMMANGPSRKSGGGFFYCQNLVANTKN